MEKFGAPNNEKKDWNDGQETNALSPEALARRQALRMDEEETLLRTRPEKDDTEELLDIHHAGEEDRLMDADNPEDLLVQDEHPLEGAHKGEDPFKGLRI